MKEIAKLLELLIVVIDNGFDRVVELLENPPIKVQSKEFDDLFEKEETDLNKHLCTEEQTQQGEN